MSLDIHTKTNDEANKTNHHTRYEQNFYNTIFDSKAKSRSIGFLWKASCPC